MSKLFYFLIVLSFVFNIACGSSDSSGSSDDLEDQLTGNSFTLIWTEERPDGVSASCSNETTGTEDASSSSVSNSTDAYEADNASGSASPYSSDNENTITFGGSTFTISGDDAMSGSWEVIDDNTLEVEVEGLKAKVDIEIEDNTLYVSNPYDVDCESSSSGTTNTESVGGSEEN